MSSNLLPALTRPRLTPLPVPGPAPTLAVLGAHGGAGTSTLSALLGAADLGCRYDDQLPPVLTSGGRGLSGSALLLACRPTTVSATYATEAIRDLAALRIPVAVLVICGDGWPETPVATARYRLLSAQVGTVTRMPFIPVIRGYGHPEQVRLRRGARNALATIRTLAGRHSQAWSASQEASRT
jgi:hypothetical protein